MTCELTPADLSAYLDGALDGDDAARAEAHVLACLRCRETLGVWRGLEGGLRADVEAPPPALAAGPALAVRRIGARRRRVRVIAATLLVASCGLAGAFGLRAGRGDPSPADDIRRSALARQATLVNALELEAGSVRLEIAAFDSVTDREAALADRLDDLLTRLDRLRDDVENAR